MTVEQRFWANVRKSEGCWEWTAHCSNGYGQIHVDGRKGRNVSTHRLSWVLTNGTIPASLCVLHYCDNPKCVRPDHLFLGTRADNNKDRDLKGRNGSAKLSANDVLAIRKIGNSATYQEIAARFGITRSTVQRVLWGESWQHIQTKS